MYDATIIASTSKLGNQLIPLTATKKIQQKFISVYQNCINQLRDVQRPSMQTVSAGVILSCHLLLQALHRMVIVKFFS